MANITNVDLDGTFRLAFTRVNESIDRINSVANTENLVTANSAIFRANNNIDFITLYNDSPAAISNEAKIKFNFNDSVSEDTFGSLSVITKNVTNSAEESDMEFGVSSSGAVITKLTLAANGQLYVPLSDNYENTVITDNVITNKKYVNDQDVAVLGDALALAIALG